MNIMEGEVSRRSWAEVSLAAIRKNLDIYREHQPEPARIMAVVKANAYGHGDVTVSRYLEENGIRHFAVSNVEEAVRLRKGGIDGEILILGYTPAECAGLLLENNIIQTLVSEEYTEALAAEIRRLHGEKVPGRVRCHYALDTGMNRIGLDADRPEYCAEVLKDTMESYSDCLELCGVFSHLCVADTADEGSKAFTSEQVRKFENVRRAAAGLALPECHLLNSAGGRNLPVGDHAWTRLGIILYGLKPDYSNTLPEGIEPAMAWKSAISMVKELHPGETVGYGRTFRADREMRIATVPTGYADGYPRLLSNRGYVLIRGKKAPIVGNVCMDQMMVDVTEIPSAAMTDEVVLLGRSGDECITADDLAHMIGTIGYEILCGISERVPRVYGPAGDEGRR